MASISHDLFFVNVKLPKIYREAAKRAAKLSSDAAEPYSDSMQRWIYRLILADLETLAAREAEATKRQAMIDKLKGLTDEQLALLVATVTGAK